MQLAKKYVPPQVGGGCQYGWVCCWDKRLRGEAGRLVAGERHEDPVYGLVWINSKTHSEIMTAGADGTVKFWDIRMFDK